MGRILNKFFTKDEQKAIVFVIAILLLGKIVYGEFVKERNVKDDREAKSAFLKKNNHYNGKMRTIVKVSINVGTKKELEKIQGIGPKTAERIVMYRNKKGKFKKLTDIEKVKGIGEKKYKRLKKYIKL